ncbi:stage II sporulation protein P [Natranaerovirga pectinivora]|uniref:Stage II sporulation protein P n=1 Tax=Natranaerovirga pectinivora TaxID=682400 RepID=A0A4V2V0M3_9FIRM|nr:stage II sporulation protein P [Natranaerovirga pectinivora]TCT16869.1 stage II sporulation protein P [Natranaerovirga pectinivora]
MERRKTIQSSKVTNIIVVLIMLVLTFNIIYKSYDIYFPDSLKGITTEIFKGTTDYFSEQILMKSVPLLSYTFNNQASLEKKEQLRGYETSYFKTFFSAYIPLIDYVLKEDSPTYHTVAELYPNIELWLQEDEGEKDMDFAELEEDVSYSDQPIDQQLPQSYIYTLDQLQDFNFLINNFYTVDNTIRMAENDFNVKKWLGKDMTVDLKSDEPKVLIYHAHSQEAFVDSRKGVVDDTVVGLGALLKEILEEEYGVNVIHHTGVYDVIDGRLDRSRAYALATEPVSKILAENPSIEVVIDLHRDGVPEHVRLVTEIDGKPTAKIMFFNGISRTLVNGKMVDNAYFPNPYVNDNMALSLQMQLKAAELFPGFTRKIYIKGYRYNMHLSPKALLIEVGAQNNTVKEARNAMPPLAQVIYEVFLGK